MVLRCSRRFRRNTKRTWSKKEHKIEASIPAPLRRRQHRNARSSPLPWRERSREVRVRPTALPLWRGANSSPLVERSREVRVRPTALPLWERSREARVRPTALPLWERSREVRVRPTPLPLWERSREARERGPSALAQQSAHIHRADDTLSTAIQHVRVDHRCGHIRVAQ